MTRPFRSFPQSHGKRLLITPRNSDTLLKAVRDEGTSGRCYRIDAEGVEVSTLQAATIVLRDVTDCVIADRNRRFNIAAAIAMFTTVLVEVPNLFLQQFLTKYQGRFTLEDPEVFPHAGAQGPYVFPVGHPWNDLTVLIRHLREAFDHQQTASLYFPAFKLDTGVGSLRCTFSVINHELYLTAAIDQLDAVRGLPYLSFLAALTLNYAANRLGLNPAAVTFQCAELFVATSDVSKALAIADMARWPYKLDPMPHFTPVELAAFQQLVTDHLTRVSFDAESKRATYRTRGGAYLLDFARVMRAYLLRDKDPGAAVQASQSITNQTLKYVLRPHIGLGSAATTPVIGGVAVKHLQIPPGPVVTPRDDDGQDLEDL